MASVFSDEEKRNLITELEQDKSFAQAIAKINLRRDTGSKILLFLFALGSAVLSAVIATYSENPPQALRVANAVAAAVATALAGFVSQFDLAGRRRIFQKKAFMFRALIDQLRLIEGLERESFLQRKVVVQGWDENNPPDENFDVFVMKPAANHGPQPDGTAGAAPRG